MMQSLSPSICCHQTYEKRQQPGIPHPRLLLPVQAMGPSARQIADQGMQAALEAFKRTHKTQPRELCAPTHASQTQAPVRQVAAVTAHLGLCRDGVSCSASDPLTAAPLMQQLPCIHHSLLRQPSHHDVDEVHGAAGGQSQPSSVTGVMVSKASCNGPSPLTSQQLLPAGPPKWKGPPGAIPPKGATPKMQPAQGGAGTIKAHQGSAPDRYRATPVS